MHRTLDDSAVMYPLLSSTLWESVGPDTDIVLSSHAPRAVGRDVNSLARTLAAYLSGVSHAWVSSWLCHLVPNSSCLLHLQRFVSTLRRLRVGRELHLRVRTGLDLTGTGQRWMADLINSTVDHKSSKFLTTDSSSRQRGRYKITNTQLSEGNFKEKEKLVTGPGWAPDTRTDWPNDCWSQINFNFNWEAFNSSGKNLSSEGD
jgi:hypothetical protein